MTDTEWGEWILHKAGEPCPIPDAKAWEWGYRHVDLGDIKATFDGGNGGYEGIWTNSITHYRVRKPAIDWKQIAGELAGALESANSALADCCDVIEYPANGSTDQDDALIKVRYALAKWKAAQ
jgi:hypothetical protein